MNFPSGLYYQDGWGEKGKGDSLLEILEKKTEGQGDKAYLGEKERQTWKLSL